MSVNGGWGSPENYDDIMEERRATSRRLVRRSMMFVPANVPKYIEKAHERGADAIILDLEDSVPPKEKVGARDTGRQAIALVSRGGADVLCRINKPFDQAAGDLDAMVTKGLAGIIFPKVEDGVEIAILSAMLLERELKSGLTPGSIGIKVSIESARGVFNTPSIIEESRRSGRVFGISYGAEDATEELGIESTPEGWERFWGNGQTVLACAHAAVQPYGRLGSAFDYKNIANYEDSIRRSMAFGFKGSACIHPAQVATLNNFYRPSEEQVTRAGTTAKVMEEAMKNGRASASVDGKMVDIPTLRRAERILERAKAIEAKEAFKKAALAKVKA